MIPAEITRTVDALMVAFFAARASPALRGLALPRYPLRELMPQERPDGQVELTVAKFGFHYKYRGPRPKSPPAIDPVAVRLVLNGVLPPPYTVTAVEDRKTYIKITIFGGN